MGKIRRRFDAQFKTQVCQAIQSGNVTLADVCREQQLSRSVVGRWLERFSAGGIKERPSSRERELERENEKLKAKVGELTMQVDVLKKMEDWKRRMQSANSSIVTASNLAQFQKPAVPSGSASRRTTTDGKPTRK
jgi:transposase-like protein